MRHDPDSGTTKRLLRRVVSTQERKRPQDLIPKGDASAWPVPRDGTTSVSAGHGAGWWAWLDLNLGPHPDRKITALTGVGGSSRRSRLWVGMWLEGWSGCCWGEGDGEPQGVQLPGGVAGLLVLVDAAGVVAGARVVVAGGGVGQQMPDDHQDGAGDGDQGLELAATLDQAPVALAQEGVGLA